MFPIFEKLGGKDATLKLLRRDARKPTSEQWPTDWAVQKWSQAGVLPGVVVIRLLRIAERRGVPVTYSDFVARRHQQQREAA